MPNHSDRIIAYVRTAFMHPSTLSCSSLMSSIVGARMYQRDLEIAGIMLGSVPAYSRPQHAAHSRGAHNSTTLRTIAVYPHRM